METAAVVASKLKLLTTKANERAIYPVWPTDAKLIACLPACQQTILC